MPAPAHSIRSRPPRGGPPSARIIRDPDILAAYLEDASHFPGGHVDGLIVASRPPACSTTCSWPCRAIEDGWRLAIREAVPAAVNARIRRAQQTIDARIAKTAADVIVPFDRFDELLSFYGEELARRRLDKATWGHVSDGNLHPNVIPHSWADAESGKEAILAFGREAIRLGGSPLAEHGVGRHPVKQQLLQELYGRQGIEDMRRVKRAIDPEWKLAPGVLFPQEPVGRT
jgi:FAD/FMN-containing dehydrogenase